MEFVLEAQAGVQSYIDCFSNMYSPSKSFESIEQALEILKVASQIDFRELMGRISLYLSCKHWSEEDEVRVQEYATSPDFPRSHLKDMVARLGMDNSKEELCDRIREYTRAVFKTCCEKGESFPEFFKGIGRGPSSELLSMVIVVINDEAKKMFVNTANAWIGKKSSADMSVETKFKLRAMEWILETLLDGVAEELVQGIVHLEAIPKYAYAIYHHHQSISCGDPLFLAPDLSKVVRIYKEVAGGDLLLRSPERIALLGHWYHETDPLCKKLHEAAAKLFLTLSLEEQVEFVKSRGERVHAYMGKVSLVTMLSKLQMYQSFE